MWKKSGPALVGLAILSCVSCSQQDPEEQPGGQTAIGRPELGTLTDIVDARDVGMPLDSFEMTREESATVGLAQSYRIRDCMRRFGLDHPVVRHPVVERMDTRRFLFGISYLPEVENYGYHRPPSPFRDAVDKPTVTALEETVLNGKGESEIGGHDIPKQGCIGEAHRELEVDNNNPRRLARSLSRKARDATESDQRLLDVYAKWNSCMTKSGYSYKTPTDAHGDPKWWKSETEVSEQELSVAKADLACRKEAKVTATFIALNIAYEMQAIDSNAESLREEKAAQDLVVKKAADILADNR